MHVQIQRRGGGQGVRTPLKNHKNIGFLSHTGLDPLTTCSYQASIQCWSIISTPAKQHLKAFHWHADDCSLIVVLGFFLCSSTKKNCQSWTPSDKVFWTRACSKTKIPLLVMISAVKSKKYIPTSALDFQQCGILTCVD